MDLCGGNLVHPSSCLCHEMQANDFGGNNDRLYSHPTRSCRDLLFVGLQQTEQDCRQILLNVIPFDRRDRRSLRSFGVETVIAVF